VGLILLASTTEDSAVNGGVESANTTVDLRTTGGGNPDVSATTYHAVTDNNNIDFEGAAARAPCCSEPTA
jgi:hypothetical protein